MALTLMIKPPSGEDDEALALTLEAPRIVIGRARGCEVMLPDPTVSGRHASIRQRGGENLIVDEGSTNGILVGSVKLPAQTPRAVRDGEMVRVGRVWLEVRTGLGVPSEPRRAEVVARQWLRHQLAADGEPVAPLLRVVEGPDRGLEILLSDPDQEIVIGRGQQANLTLADELISRRHASVCRLGADWVVRDLGSKRGSFLAEVPLDAAGVPWRSGTLLRLGDSAVELHDPVPEALDEVLAAPDERMSPREFAETPPGVDAAEEPPLVSAPEEVGYVGEEAMLDETSSADGDDGDEAELEPVDGRQGSMPIVETVVVLLALAMLAASVAALVWLLGS